MHKLLALVIVALAVPAIALATPPAQPGKSTPKALYVLKGTVTSFTPSAGGANGSITLTVSKSNLHRAALKDKSLTLVVTPQTKIVLGDDGTLAAGEKAIVKVKELKRTTDALALLNGKNAKQVIDQGPTS